MIARLGRWMAVAGLAAALTGGSPAGARTIILDGRDDDWAGVEPAWRAGERVDGIIGLKAVAITHDADAVYLRLEMAQARALQELPGSLEIRLDLDNDATTGPAWAGMGVDLAYLCSPIRDGSPQAGEAAAVYRGQSSKTLPREAVGMVHAPTYADRFQELALPREALRRLGLASTTLTVGMAVLDETG